MAVLSMDDLAESMTDLVITLEDSDEENDEMPFSVRSIDLSPSTRLRLFMEGDSFIPAFNNRFEVAISEDSESGLIEFIGSARAVSTCLSVLEDLKENEDEFAVRKMSIEKEVHGRLVDKRNKRLIEIMETHDVYILHTPFPLSFPSEIKVASMDGERLEKAVVEIEKMGEKEEEEEEEKGLDEVVEAVVENKEENRAEEEGEEVLNEDGNEATENDAQVEGEKSDSTESWMESISSIVSSSLSSIKTNLFGPAGCIGSPEDSDSDDEFLIQD